MYNHAGDAEALRVKDLEKLVRKCKCQQEILMPTNKTNNLTKLHIPPPMSPTRPMHSHLQQHHHLLSDFLTYQNQLKIVHHNKYISQQFNQPTSPQQFRQPTSQQQLSQLSSRQNLSQPTSQQQFSQSKSQQQLTQPTG